MEAAVAAGFVSPRSPRSGLLEPEAATETLGSELRGAFNAAMQNVGLCAALLMGVSVATYIDAVPPEESRCTASVSLAASFMGWLATLCLGLAVLLTVTMAIDLEGVPDKVCAPQL